MKKENTMQILSQRNTNGFLSTCLSCIIYFMGLCMFILILYQAVMDLKGSKDSMEPLLALVIIESLKAWPSTKPNYLAIDCSDLLIQHACPEPIFVPRNYCLQYKEIEQKEALVLLVIMPLPTNSLEICILVVCLTLHINLYTWSVKN